MKKATFFLATILCMSIVFVGCGTKNVETESKATIMEEVEEIEYRMIGVENEDAYQMLLKNETGSNIVGISMKTSLQPEYPVNMMPEGESIVVDEVVKFFYMPEEVVPVAEGENPDAIAVNITYQLQVTFEDGSVLALSSIGLDDIDSEVEVALCKEEVLYVKYDSLNGDSVDTKEQELGEKARLEAEAQAAAEAAAAQAAAEAAAAQAAAEAAAAQAAAEAAAAQAAAEAAAAQAAAQQQSAPTQSSDQCIDPNDLAFN